VRLHRWGLGFRQFSFRPIARVSRDGTFSVFQWLPLLWHALFPSSFRSQVNQMTQEHSSEFLLTASGIQLRVPRRTLSTHTAQASDDAPIRSAVAPIGLGVNLGVTATVPATEMTSMARAAPAEVVATSPTVLLCSLRRLAGGSRPPTPEGSRPAFAWSDVAKGSTPIRPITGRRSLLPPSFTRSPIDAPRGGPTLAGELRAYHVASRERAWVRSRLYAGGPSSAPGEIRSPRAWPRTVLVRACQHLGLVFGHDACGGSPGLTIPRAPGPRPPRCWQSRPRLAPRSPSRGMRLRCPESFAPPRCQGRTPR
jgi:hypothetical protein